MIAYFGIALVVWYVDAMSCYNKKVRFRLSGSLLCSVFWPVTCLVTIVEIARLTRRFPILKIDMAE